MLDCFYYRYHEHAPKVESNKLMNSINVLKNQVMEILTEIQVVTFVIFRVAHVMH
jgi:hypothetical protein